MIKALVILHADKIYMPGETLKLLRKEEERLIAQGLAVAYEPEKAPDRKIEQKAATEDNTADEDDI